MKFIKSIQVLAVIAFLAVNLSQVWSEFKSVDFGKNGSVYYQSGATQEEAKSLASYLGELQVDDADFRVERDSQSNALVVSMIPGAGTSSGALNAIGQELEENVFGEHVVIAACDDKFHVIYKVNEVPDPTVSFFAQ